MKNDRINSYFINVILKYYIEIFFLLLKNARQICELCEVFE